MDLYAYAGDLDLSNLIAFCQERKEESPAEAFYYIVIFDDSANAVFPTAPFTAEYGSDEEASKHIRAIYVYNKKNGFSELRHYERNMWESVANTEKV